MVILDFYIIDKAVVTVGDAPETGIGETMTTIAVDCKHCGKSFACARKELNRGRKFCSHPCYIAAGIASRTRTKDCDFCGKPFRITPKFIKRGQKFCSDLCRTTASRKYDGPSSIACRMCGKEFKVSPCNVRNGRAYCSVACMADSKKASPEIPTWAVVSCEQCGHRFESRWIAAERNYQRFCSGACRDRAHRAAMKGEGNPLFKPKVHCSCGFCGKAFTKYPCRVSALRGTRGDFCSRHCAVAFRNANPAIRTDIEIATAKMLVDADIPFREQVSMYNRWVVDFVVDNWNLIIFCDGEYWHDKPSVAAKDRGQTAYLEKCGWNVVRLRGKEIKSAPAECLRRILAYRSPAVAR